MNLERWLEIKEIVQRALDLPPEERPSYLDEACSGDSELRQEVEALLAVSSSRADFFDDFQVVPPGFQEIVLKEGDAVGPYTVVRPLGEGGMGAVYLAQDTQHDRLVALKVVPRRHGRIPRHEQKLLSKLQHQNIATFYESVPVKDDFESFIMEYVEGEPITDYCAQRDLTLQERMALFLKVCDAVSFAHQNLVVHRDIKPKNILVNADGVPKLLDFGIAKLLSQESSTTPTATNEGALTVAFASPEQLEGEHTTTSTDIYSLGVLLCLLLSGRLPYPVESYHDLPWAIRNIPPSKPSLLVTQDWQLKRLLEGDLDAITLEALRRTPDERYQTVDQLAADIRHFLRSEPVSASNGGTPYKIRKFVKRHRLEVAISAAAIVGLLVLSILLLIMYREATRQRQQAQDQARRAEAVTSFIVELFESSDPWDPSPETVSVKDLLTSAAQRTSVELSREPALQATLRATLGSIFTNLGDYPRAEELLVPALKSLSSVEQPDPRVVGKTWYFLGGLRHNQGKYKQAVEAHQTALTIQESIQPPDQLAVITTRAALAESIEETGDLDTARTHYQAALQDAVALTSSGGDLLRADILTRFAALERAASNYAAAEQHSRTALTLLQKRLPPSHPRIGLVLNNLGVVLSNMEKREEAETIYKAALNLYTASLGPKHPETLKTKTSLGELLRKQGRLLEARSLQREVLQARQQILPPDHPDRAKSLINLAIVLLETGPLSEAEHYLRDAHRIERAELGEQHPALATSIANLASALLLQERYDEADQLFVDALKRVEQSVGREHSSYALYQGNRAQALLNLGRLQEAEEAAREAIAVAQKVYGNDHTRVAILRGTLARIRLKQGRIIEAERISRETVRKVSQDFGATSSSTIKAQTLLAEILLTAEKYSEAEPLLLTAFTYWKERAGAEAPPTLQTAKLLDRLYSSWGRLDRAEEYRKLRTPA